MRIASSKIRAIKVALSSEMGKYRSAGNGKARLKVDPDLIVFNLIEKVTGAVIVARHR
jgi:hypothetical protein